MKISLHLRLRLLLFHTVLFIALSAASARAQSTFTQRNLTPNSNNLLWSFASGGGAMVAVGQPGRILSSTDGVTWTPRSSGTNEWIVAVAYGNGLFVAVGDNGRILRSADGGVSWTYASNLATIFRLNDIIYTFGKWIAVGESGIILTSTDANTWTSTPSGTTRWLHGLATSGPFLCTVGQAGTILISTDGLAWTPRNSTTTRNLEVVTYVNGYFAVVGEAGEYVFASASGGAQFWNNYTAYKPATTANLRAIASGGGSIVAVSDTGEIFSTPFVFSPWTRRTSGTTSILNAVGFARDAFFILGLNDVILQSEGIFDGRLGNLSTRGQVGVGGNILISGLVVRGTASKRLLLRAAGPALTAFGLTGTLARPILSLFDGAGRPLFSNTGWTTAANVAEIRAAAQQVGAFAFPDGSADCALLITLPPGSYTTQVSGGGPTGLALLESYDLDNLTTMQSRLVNLSSRGLVGTDQNIIIPGITTGGTSARLLLVRAIGPALDAFGVTGTLTDPQITVTRTTSPVTVATNDNWNTQLSPTNATFTAADIRDYSARAGAFSLPENSRDAALLFTTSPGANYTVQVSGTANTTGTGLVEVYDVTGL
jgi:photosystem II stability/assembly factor-like uncharacterized protein